MSYIRWTSDGKVLTGCITEAKILDELVIRQIQDEMIRVVERAQEPNVVIDFQFVKFLSSSALGMLIRSQRRCKDRQINLMLCHVGKEIEKIFKITALHKIMAIYPGDPPPA